MPKKVEIRWLMSNDPKDVNESYPKQLWPTRLLKGNLTPGCVAKTIYRGEQCFVLIVDKNSEKSDDSSDEDSNIRLADLGAPPCSNPPEKSKPRVQEEEKDEDFVPDSDEQDSDSDQSEIVREELLVHSDIEEGDADPGESGSRKKRKSDPTQYAKAVRKRKLAFGEAHKNSKGKDVPQKQPRSMEKHPGNCKLQCNAFTEEERESICRAYWGLGDRKRQKDWILSNIEEKETARHKLGAQKQVACRRQYSIIVGEEKRRVCRQFFIDTICVSYNLVLDAWQHGSEHKTYVHEDQRGKHRPKHALSDEDKEFLMDHIRKLPQQESHYCRSNTKRRYLLGFNSIRAVWDSYKQASEEQGPDL